MFSRRFKFLGLFLFAIILVVSSIIPSSGKINSIGFPQYKTSQMTYQSNKNNDFYIQGNPFLSSSENTYDLQFNTTQMSETVYHGKSNSPLGNIGSNPSFYGAPNTVMQFLNTSNAGASVTYSTHFYSLLDQSAKELGQSNKDISQSGNLALYAYHWYGFTVSFDKINPAFFSVLFSEIASTTSLTLYLNMYDPHGNLNSTTISVTRNVVSMIPLFPLLTGKYYVFLEVSRDAVLSKLSLNKNPDIVNISNGISEHLQGSKTTGKFLKVDPNNITEIFNIHSLIFNSYYLNYLAYLGSISLYAFHSGRRNLFGYDFTSTYFTTNQVFYISVVAKPPDESDPSIKSVKKNEGLPSGFDLDYTILIEKYDLTNLPINVDAYSKPNATYSDLFPFIFYKLKLNYNSIVSLNSSTDFSMNIYSIDRPQSSVISINSINNDILNYDTTSGILLPSGIYCFRVPEKMKFRFSIYSLDQNIDVQSLNSKGSTFYNATLGNSKFYFLPVSMQYDHLNITGYPQVNQSIGFNFQILDSNGLLLSSYPASFENYTDNTSTKHVNTEYTIDFSHPNLNGYILRVTMTTNTQYNNTDGYSLYSKVNNITLGLDIRRNDLLTYNQKLIPSNIYQSSNLANSTIVDLPKANTTIIEYYLFKTEANQSYRFTLDSINRTMVYEFYTDNNILWYSGYIYTNTTIDNQDHYITTLEFSTTESITIGIYLSFGLIASNGTFNIYYTNPPMINLPPPNLIELSSKGFGASQSIFSNPWFYAGVFGGIGIIAIAVVIMRRRGILFKI